MKRVSISKLEDLQKFKAGKYSRQERKPREERLLDFEKWCRSTGKITISNSAKFDMVCVAGHGLRATAHIKEGEEIVRIPRTATIQRSARLENVFKRYPDVESHPWLPIILSLMVEWDRPDSHWAPYVDWLPKQGEMPNLPHNWPAEKNSLLKLLGLEEQVDDDAARMKADWQKIQPIVTKFPELFKVEQQNLEKLFNHCALLMMSYSFTDPEPEEKEENLGNSFCLEEQTKPEPVRFMLPVGDLLNHTFENNARIEFDVDALTINATRDIKNGEEIFNTFGDMSNSRLLQMYGFCETDNKFDDLYILPSAITSVVQVLEVDAVSAKTKFLDSHGFIDEVRVCAEDELNEQVRAMIAIFGLNRPGFNKMVKDSKKKAKESESCEMSELEIEIGSNKIEHLDETEQKILREMVNEMKSILESEDLSKNDEINIFSKLAIQGSLTVIEFIYKELEKCSDECVTKE